MKTVVFGYHNIGYACLTELVKQGHEVAAVVTHEDDPAEEVWFASVAELARSRGLPVLTPRDPNTPEFVAQIRELAPEIIFSFYYRSMLKAPLLAIPPRGCLNLHGSYLPAYRGRCPVNWVLVNGEAETGVTLHYMVEKPDAGDIVAQRKVTIDFADTAATLYERMTAAARTVMAATLPLLAAGTAPRVPQDHSRASYYGGRRPEDGRFEWSFDALRIHNLVRAVTHPYPGAFTAMGRDKLTVWACYPHDGSYISGLHTPGTVVQITPAGPVVATGSGMLALLAVQVADGPELSGSEFTRAYALSVGASLCADRQQAPRP